jgi:hypothetical protein
VLWKADSVFAAGANIKNRRASTAPRLQSGDFYSYHPPETPLSSIRIHAPPAHPNCSRWSKQPHLQAAVEPRKKLSPVDRTIDAFGGGIQDGWDGPQR